MFSVIKNFFRSATQTKTVAYIDGDQDVPAAIDAYSKYIKGTTKEVYFVRAGSGNDPKSLRRSPHYNELTKIRLKGFASKKEITDKYITALIQKAVTEGYGHITVVSSDYDFIDIFKMAMILNPQASNVTFRMIVPTKAVGKVATCETQQGNIEVIRTKDVQA